MFFGPFRSGRVTSSGRPFGSLLMVACGPLAPTDWPEPPLPMPVPVPPVAPGKSSSPGGTSFEATSIPSSSPSPRNGPRVSSPLVGADAPPSSGAVFSATVVPSPAAPSSSGGACTLITERLSFGESGSRPWVKEESKADCWRTRENSTNEPAATAARAVPTTPGVIFVLCLIPNPFLPSLTLRARPSESVSTSILSHSGCLE